MQALKLGLWRLYNYIKYAYVLLNDKSRGKPQTCTYTYMFDIYVYIYS